MSVPARPVRVRMAPSPTGFVHLGNARAALFCLVFALQKQGTFVLRIDDTDVERNRPEYEQAVYDGLHWLDLRWDEGPDVGGRFGPYRQSERTDLYREAAARLLEAGDAYRCYCTPEEIEAEREAAQRSHLPYRYSRRCLTNPPAGRREFAVRFRVPEGETVLQDLVRREVRFDNAVIGDPVILRTNGMPVYNFASPVDDAQMEISHVIRGDEHLSNTPIQIMLLHALGHPEPVFAHLPVIVGKDGKKLSKRKHPETRLGLYRELGYLPEALLNYLALLGWNPGTEQEIFSFQELVEAFSFERVQRSNAMFDWDKLDWIDGQYIRRLSDEELAGRLRPYLPGLPEEKIRQAAPGLKERLARLGKAAELLAYLEAPPEAPRLEDGQREMVAAALSRLREVEWTPEAVESALEDVRQAHGWSRGKFFTPLREAVAGRISPPIHETLALLPRDEALRRLSRVLR
jgi:glutamyl-tRNA synthetase